MVESVKDMHQLTDDVANVKVQVLNNSIAYEYRDAMAKKLDSLAALEESTTLAIRTRMVNKVKADVISTFSKDAKAKENALNQAIAVLSAGTNAKFGKDIVGEQFKSSIKDYRDAYSKLPEGSDEILKNLQKEMAAIAVDYKVSLEAKSGH